MKSHLSFAAVGASILAIAVPASAANTLTLVCKCQSVVVNGDERGCADQSARTVVVDIDNETLQWSYGPREYPAIKAYISPVQIRAMVEPGTRDISGRLSGLLKMQRYTINRISGEYLEEGTGYTTDKKYPNIDFRVPATVSGICTKVDAPKF